MNNGIKGFPSLSNAIADESVTGTKLATSAADGVSLEVASGSMRVKDAGITAAKLAAAVAGDGLAGGAGTALSVSVDNSTVEISGDALRVKDAGITATKLAGAAITHVAEGRLTLVTQTPVADSASSGTIYYASFTGNHIALYSGTTAGSGRWELLTIGSEISITPGATLTSARNYDVYAYNNAGTATLELKIWDSGGDSQTRVTNTHNRQDGVLVLNSDYKRRFLGTIRTISTSATQDNEVKRFVRNYYNRVPRTLVKTDTTNSWTYALDNTLYQANNSTANQVEIVQCVAEDLIELVVKSLAVNATTNVNVMSGVGVDSSTVNSAQVYGGGLNTTSPVTNFIGRYIAVPTLGYHYYAWLEGSSTALNTTFVGDNGTVLYQSGMTGVTLG